MLRRATALYIRTGTFSSPKLIEPDQIALAMRGLFQRIGVGANWGARSGRELRGVWAGVRANDDAPAARRLPLPRLGACPGSSASP